MSINNLRFLVAEDHDFQRGMLVNLLGVMGAQAVHEAADGHGALSILQDPARPVDIVISDLDMPGMDGMEFIRRLGETKANVSIILASALERKLLASIATMTEAYGITLLGVVEKPLTPAKLAPLIQRHLPTQAKRVPLATPAFTRTEVEAALDNDEFEPFFQPKIELSTGRVKGAEALARWRHPQRGIVLPGTFIPLLEELDLIDELTWVILQKAAAFCSTWRATGADASVSVNLSIKSLNDVRIAEQVTALVQSQGVDPHHLILEVTESAVTIDIGATLENLARLRMKGFGLSIDDYGTGYSSMQQLTRIAFTELKIDQSFVMNASREDSARVILESSLRLAKKLGITSVAEGVETREDFQLLCRLHCDMAQGYFIARPMDGAAFLGWVRERK